MAYEKIGFKSRDRLKAEHLNHIEDGIGQLSEEKADQFTVGEGLQMSEDRVLSAVGGGSGGGSGVASNELHVNLMFDMDANTFTSDVSVNDAYDWWMNKGPVYVHFNEYSSIKVHTVLGSDSRKTLEFYQLVRMDSQGFNIVIYQWCSTPDGDRFYMEEVRYGSGEQQSYTTWNGKE